MNSNAKVIEQNEEVAGFNFIVEPSRRKSVKKANVILEGKLNIYYSAEILNKFKEVIHDYNVVDFKLRDVEEIDVSVLQTIYYFTQFFNKGEKKISFQLENPSREIRAILTKTKYQTILFKKPSNLAA